MKKTLEKKILSIGLITIGIAAIIFAIICSTGDPCMWRHFSNSGTYKTYGGDAYTGIQNATVDVTRNIQYLDLDLAYATTFLGECIGYLLFIVGGLLLLIGTTKAISAFRKKPTLPDEVQADVENN